jgi:hypothetical protein
MVIGTLHQAITDAIAHGHRLSALDRSVIGAVCLNPNAHRNGIDALLRADTGNRNIDCVNESWSGAVVEFDNGQATTHTGVDTEDLHRRPQSR